MPYTYPPSGPTISGDIVTTQAFLKDPASVQERVRDLANHAFVSDILFPTPVEATGGAVSYQLNTPLVTDRDPSAVAPGGEYEMALAQGGVPQLARVTKYGQDVPLTDEAIGRLKINAADRALRQSVNRTITFIDTLALSVASAAITRTYTASNAWNTSAADPLLDVLLAAAAVTNADADSGYDPDLLIITATLYARLAANKDVVTAMQADNTNSVIVSGQIQQIGGKRVAPVPDARMPAGVSAILVDTMAFGAYAYENIPSPEYQGAPMGIQTWTRRDPKATDSWLIRTRRPYVPLVENSDAAIKIAGV